MIWRWLCILAVAAMYTVACQADDEQKDTAQRGATYKEVHAKQDATDKMRYAASQILIAHEDSKPQRPRTKEEAYQKAKQLIAKLKKDPTLFRELAKSDSDGSEIDNGGYLMWAPGATVHEFQKAVDALEIGEMTEEPVNSRFGYFIIRRERLYKDSY